MPKSARTKAAKGTRHSTAESRSIAFKTPPSCAPLPRKVVTSVPKTRQQTLTQINFVTYRPNDDDDLDLDYEVPDPTPPPKRKRLMGDDMPARTARTRSSKRLMIKSEETTGTQDENRDPIHESDGLFAPVTRSIADMKPPETPRKAPVKGKREIPSSQSPPDTPLTTRSQRPRRLLVSPLQEISTNLGPTYSPCSRKGIGPRQRLEVQDTYEPSQWAINTCATSLEEDEADLNQETPDIRPVSPVAEGSPVRRKSSVSPSVSGIQNHIDTVPQVTSVTIKSEIIDPEEEADIHLHERCDPKSTPRASSVYKQSDSTANDSRCKQEVNSNEEIVSIKEEPDLPEPKDRHYVSYEPPTQLSSTTAGSEDDNSLPPSIRGRPAPSSMFRSSPPPLHGVDSCQGSAQLNINLRRHTKPFIPKPEPNSQLWGTRRPPSPINLISDPNLPEHTSRGRSAPLNTLPNQDTNLISQATTTDSSHSSSSVSTPVPGRRPFHSSPQDTRTSASSPRRSKTNHEPYPVIILSSSPTTTRTLSQTDMPRAPWEIDPMTDSQMLPDDVMNFSTPTLPEWPSTQESLLEEEEPA